LISLAPKSSFDSYKPTLNKEDLVISKQDIYELIDNTPSYLLEALIIRTHPNNDIKKSQNYMKSLPSFFSIDAMKYIKSKGVKHLLVDIPSVDRLFDEGNLSAHNIFWDTIDKKFNPLTKNHTITEMIFVDNTIADGSYLLNLQIPAFIADAAPSRPIIFKLYDI
jgi:kynurenine formamidase